MKSWFDFYGLIIQVQGKATHVIEEVRRDFAYFSVSQKNSDIRIDLFLTPPPYDHLPSLPAAFFTPRNVCFRQGDTTYVDYFGKGLSIFDRKRRCCEIYGEDIHLVHEICYLFVLSMCGQFFDKRKIHRVHALAVSKQNAGVLLMLPSGGGKSTVALRLLGNTDYRLLSEDTPLINNRGEILPFPLRIGVRPEAKHGISEKYVRTIKRMEFDPKTLIDIEAFQDRLGKKVGAKILLVGERNLGRISEIIPISRSLAFKGLVKYMIVGLGVYQGLEFLLERGPWELFGKFHLAFSRLHNAFALLSRADCYKFVMGRDIEKNCDYLLAFLDSAL